MKLILTWLCLATSLFIILLTMNAFNEITLFIIAGEVPTTNYVLSPGAMLLIFSGVTAAVIGLYIVSRVRHLSHSEPLKRPLPKQRYRRV